jgi:hypothetical protein
MGNQKFGGSVGHKGSAAVNTASVKLSDAKGSAVTGYRPAKGWSAGGAPEPERGASKQLPPRPAPKS